MTHILTRDADSVVNCFAVHRGRTQVTIRCSKQFAEMLRANVEQRAEGFAGVVFQESGRGWFAITSRDTLHDRPEVGVDEATAQLFLEYAHIAVLELMADLDESITVITADVRKNGPLREHRSVTVRGAVSSRPVKPALSQSKLNQLQTFASASRRGSRRTSA